MWKKILLSLLLIVLILSGLYYFKTKNTAESPVINNVPEQTASFEEKAYEYDAANLPESCDLNSEMACAVDFAVKCTLNPDYQGCRGSKLPSFIFMEDENLQRPTQMSFQIAKIKPIAADLIELHTDSTCNGNWFGLCQGRVIYVLVPDGEHWRVKDIYAIER